MTTGKPRRCSARYRDADCPDEVYCIMDSKHDTDRYTIVYGKPYTYDGKTYVDYLGTAANPNQFSGTDCITLHELAAYRYRFKHQYIRWSELPQAVRDLVMRLVADAKSVPCEACNAEAGEPCRPHCIGQAAYTEANN